MLADERDASGIALLFTAALGAQREQLDLLLTEVIEACRSHLFHSEFWLEYSTVVELAGPTARRWGARFAVDEPGDTGPRRGHLPARRAAARLPERFRRGNHAKSDNVLAVA